MISNEELDLCYDFGLKLAAEAGEIIEDAIQGVKNIETKAGDWDLVTQYDKKVEETVINSIAKKFPKHKFIGEETVSSTNSLPELTDEPTWIIDPIDGTTNFVHSFPFTCVSIALSVNKELEIGVVYNPVLKQLFTARKGSGAFLNGKPIKSSKVEQLEHSLLCLEASYATIESIRDIVLGRMEAFVSVAHGIRTMGSAALTLCYVAMGAAEAYHCDNLMPWDVAAGVLIIREAGGVVIDTSGGEFNVSLPKVIAAGNRNVAVELVKLIKKADAATSLKKQA
ncbi:inositol monophosphatase 1 [Megalopta genalis]|uniref:inositol monophosphatase 1 n=1 Tax=Megalopta genalis TaxID=115081 RepID=UPI0014432065|nr:inositol monophosphatase 1-like [Megalopta genalis]XP_033339709.1 inositol monophosphatase 1-like [Megalopta genalis]